MLYELINMSDPYTLEAGELDVALVVCLFLGNGQYALQPLEAGGEAVPFFMFDMGEGWCEQHFQQSLEATIDRVVEEKPEALAACLESVLIGDVQDRKTFEAGLALITDPAKRDEWRKRWHEQRISSVNDIGSRAHEMARRLREKLKIPLILAPPQVFAS